MKYLQTAKTNIQLQAKVLVMSFEHMMKFSILPFPFIGRMHFVYIVTGYSEDYVING